MQIYEIAKKFYFYVLETPIAFLGSIGLFFMAFRLNTIMTAKFGSLLTNASAAFIEEGVRFISIYVGGSVAVIFTPLMALMEFFIYINREPHETFIPSFIAMRVICVGIHLLCFYVQSTIFRKGIEKNDNTYFFLAYVSAVLIHLSYNTFFAYFIHAIVKTLYL
jgi:hypothetical protein